MLSLIDDLPETVLGIAADGQVTGEEYENVLMPAMEGRFLHINKLNILFLLKSGFSGFTLPAVIDDAKIGLKYIRQWGKVAVVSDHHLINGYTRLISHLLPMEIKVFNSAELAEAKAWITA
ncbi:MAG: STAS/SEC14 domain-containing protein [Mucilaginibacter sp.]